MLDYASLYERVNRCLTKDYAGWEKESIVSALSFHRRARDIPGRTADRIFFQEIRSLLAKVSDPALRLRNTRAGENWDWGSGVTLRTDEEGRLYVVSVYSSDTPLKAEDEILSIDRKSLSEIRNGMTGPLCHGEGFCREDWENVLSFASCVSILRNGEELKNIRFYGQCPIPEAGEIRLLHPREDTVQLVLSGNVEREPLTAFLEAEEELLLKAKYLLIDLRNCQSRQEDALFPLLPYCAETLSDLEGFLEEERLFVHYTESNVKRFLAQIETSLGPKANWNEEMKSFFAEFRQELLQKADKGIEEEENESLLELLDYAGAGRRKEARVLLDLPCRDGGEVFAKLLRRCTKIPFYGRNSMGSLDYRTELLYKLDKSAIFSYPMAMTKAAREGKGIGGKGIGVDVEIPFTKEEIREDKILQRVLEEI